MPSVVFVAPYSLESTLRFVRAAAALPEVTLGIVTQEEPGGWTQRLEASAVREIAGCVRVGNALDADQLEAGIRQLAPDLGGRVDAVIGILEPLQETLGVVRERMGIRGMDASEARNFRDKAHMKDLLRAADLPCARHCLATSAEQALAFAQELLPLVAKPPAGAGAVDTFRVDTVDQLQDWTRRHAPSAERPLLLEEFIQGEEFSFDTISVGGQHVFHSISTYAPTPLRVMETPWIQWTVMLPRDISGSEYDPIRHAGPAALSTLGMQSGMSHMEWFRREDGTIAISEVGARPPGAQITSLLSYAHDRDFYSAWAEVNIFERFDPPERKYATGAAYLRGQGDGRVVQVDGIEAIQRELGDLVVEAKLPQQGQAKASSYEGEGYVILRHTDSDVVADGLREVVSKLQVRMGNRS